MRQKLLNFCKNNRGLLFILPSLIGVCLFFLFPYLDVVKQSVTSSISSNWLGLAHYQEVIQNQAFQLAVKNTLRFVSICLPILLVTSLSFALVLKGNSKLSNWIKTGFLFPMVIPVASIAFFWKLMFEKQGFLNLILDKVGISTIDWMNSNAAFWILVFTYVWKNLGYNLILWLAGLSGISESIYEAAKIDGANKWEIFWYVTIPNLLPTFFIITVLSLLNTFKIFREAYLVAGEYPHQSIYLIQHVFNNWFREVDMGKMAAGNILNIVVIMIFILGLQNKWGKLDE